MTYRLLPEHDWYRLTPDFAHYGMRRPASGSRIAVAEDTDGTIAGFLVLQWVPHAEPLVVHEAYAGRVYWPHLLHLLEAELHGGELYVFAPDERIRALATAADCTPLPWTVLRKEVPCRS